jgi:MinD-like ATPase involved in chromosome partitioning or flagellar assembly
VGTSSVCAALGAAAHLRGERVLLVDGAEHTSTIGPLFGIPGSIPGLGLVIRGEARPEELLVALDDRFDLLPGGDPEPELAARESRGRLAGAYRAVSHLHGAYDRVFIDGGSRLASIVAGLAGGAGRLALVTTADGVALAGAYAVLKVVTSGPRRLSGDRVGLLVNRCEADSALGVAAIDQFVEAADHFLGVRIASVGALPSDPAALAALAGDRDTGFGRSALAGAAAAWTARTPEEPAESDRKTLPIRPSPPVSTPGPQPGDLISQIVKE